MKTRTMKMGKQIPAEVKGRRVTVFLKEDYAKPVFR